MADYNDNRSDGNQGNQGNNGWIESIFDDYRFDLVAEKTDEMFKPARCKFSIIDNCPRWTTVTNVKSDQDNDEKGKIVASLDIATFFVFLGRLRTILRAEPGTKGQPIIYRTGPLTNMVEKSRIQYGKGTDGIVYMAITAEGRPSIAFKFLPAPHHRPPQNANVDMAEMSMYYAEGYINALERLAPIVLQVKYKRVEFENKDNRGGKNGGWKGKGKGGYNAGGGGNYRSGGGGNYRSGGGSNNYRGGQNNQSRQDNDWDPAPPSDNGNMPDFEDNIPF